MNLKELKYLGLVEAMIVYFSTFPDMASEDHMRNLGYPNLNLRGFSRTFRMTMINYIINL